MLEEHRRRRNFGSEPHAHEQAGSVNSMTSTAVLMVMLLRSQVVLRHSRKLMVTLLRTPMAVSGSR
jgi:hypothetical protein